MQRGVSDQGSPGTAVSFASFFFLPGAGTELLGLLWRWPDCRFPSPGACSRLLCLSAKPSRTEAHPQGAGSEPERAGAFRSLGGEGRCSELFVWLAASLLPRSGTPCSQGVFPSGGLPALRMLHGANSFTVPPSSEHPLPLCVAGQEVLIGAS